MCMSNPLNVSALFNLDILSLMACLFEKKLLIFSLKCGKVVAIIFVVQLSPFLTPFFLVFHCIYLFCR